ncbi:DUF2145 domain-containing protein [Ideonella azotifigens]|uniref:DUF2145 domain-containing protein n=1 Tax=Ideonella azotifigens TaxID=513160 RepID=A0ABN1JQF3_9BURK|nr:DUF2145 domain-containing protein [Ideonella azotifigens]MCD2340180.1 DUF2145 domain-containing protein [Ideonella azotifigens]
MTRGSWGALPGACLILLAGTASASSLQFCDLPADLNGAQQDRMFRFAAVVRQVLQQSGSSAAIIARSGQNLERFGQRYSHTGVALADSANGPWSVRQLYYACDEKMPRLFDQGVAGFISGTDKPDEGYVSLLLPTPEQAEVLARLALSNAEALRLLGADYSANAFPFSTRYQNCNQWVAELLAAAWGPVALQPEQPRERAQAWLSGHGYTPTLMDASAPWLALVKPFIPFVHDDDHPTEEAESRIYRVSMPASIEGLVRDNAPQVQRVELCHAGTRVVVHRGWSPLGAACEPGEGDEVLALD